MFHQYEELRESFKETERRDGHVEGGEAVVETDGMYAEFAEHSGSENIDRELHH